MSAAHPSIEQLYHQVPLLYNPGQCTGHCKSTREVALKSKQQMDLVTENHSLISLAIDLAIISLTITEGHQMHSIISHFRTIEEGKNLFGDSKTILNYNHSPRLTIECQLYPLEMSTQHKWQFHGG